VTPVQGYGLVVGLSGTGSRECPDPLRAELEQEIAKRQYAVRRHGDDQKIVSPAELLASMATAVVKVTGYIPAGAVVGERFEVFVEALPNTQTTSLEGGRLFTTDLRLYNPVFIGASKPMATAGGQVFINPFQKPKGRDRPTLRRQGYILDGGRALEARELRLVLHQPSYSLARAIGRRINDRFAPPGEQIDFKAADAVGPGVVQLHIPRSYADQRDHFLGLVRNLFIRSDAAYLDMKARELGVMILQPDANARSISLAWESIGKTALPVIQPLYANSNRQASFRAAQAGARLGDALGAEVVGRFAANARSRYRREAIETLAYCRSAVAGAVLTRLLDDKNVQVRTWALQSLKKRKDPIIHRMPVGVDNFMLDSIRQGGQPIIYVSRTGRPSITILGKGVRLQPPLFYVHPDQSVTIKAQNRAEDVTIIRRTARGRGSGPVQCSLDLEDFVKLLGGEAAVDADGRVTGLGLSYSHVVAILKSFCDDGVIEAKFILQQPAAMPTRPIEEGRPERDVE